MNRCLQRLVLLFLVGLSSCTPTRPPARSASTGLLTPRKAKALERSKQSRRQDRRRSLSVRECRRRLTRPNAETLAAIGCSDCMEALAERGAARRLQLRAAHPNCTDRRVGSTAGRARALYNAVCSGESSSEINRLANRLHDNYRGRSRMFRRCWNATKNSLTYTPYDQRAGNDREPRDAPESDSANGWWRYEVTSAGPHLEGALPAPGPSLTVTNLEDNRSASREHNRASKGDCRAMIVEMLGQVGIEARAVGPASGGAVLFESEEGRAFRVTSVHGGCETSRR